MDLSIIILNYKTKNLIKHQLKSLYSLSWNFSYEVIVVDNASDDGIGEMIAVEFPQTVFIQNTSNAGYAAGNNLAIRRAQGQYILILNPDIVILRTEDLEKLWHFMQTHPQAGIAGPKLSYPNNEIQESCSRWPNLLLPIYRRTFLKDTAGGKKWLDHYFYRDWDHQSNKQVDWLFGAALMIRKEALIKVGLLDESYFLYLEDTDWCRRFWEQGYQVWFVADSILTHYHKRSSADNGIFGSLFNKSSREHIKSFIKYLRKYQGKQDPHTEL